MFNKKKIRQLISEVDHLKHEISILKQQNDSQKILQANSLTRLNTGNIDQILQNIQLAEFTVFSQWGDDGIIQFLVNYLDIDIKTFIEFGVETYIEANTRFLLLNNNWTGLIMDGSEQNINKVKQDDIYWKYQLTAVPAFITAENINDLITQNGFSDKTGLLHVDIDGNDYWVWKAIKTIRPVIVIMEYNSVFGIDNPWTVPYKADFFRTDAHHSNLYFGSSLLSLCDLAEEKGYAFIGSNSHGNNAYFIRKDKLKGIKALTPEEGYVESKFRESRDEQGNLTYFSGADRLKAISGMEIYNTRTNTIEKI